jgi:hypothetical protein
MSSRAFTAQTFAWLRQVNTDRHLLAIDLKVAVELTRYFRENDQGGRAYPAAKTLADAVGLSERSVRRSIDRLHHAGHLYVIPGKPGRGCSTQYWMVLKTGTATPVFEGQKTGIRKTGIRGKKTGTATPEILRESIPKRVSLEGNPSWEGERVATSSLEESSLPAGTPSLTRGPAGEDASEDSLPIGQPPSWPEKESGADEIAPPPPLEGAFRELREIWRRGHASDDTPKAVAVGRAIFAKVCAAGAEPGEILAAAKTWVAAFEAGDGARYLPALTAWLVTRGWEKPPPAKAKRITPAGKSFRRNGDGLPRSNGGKRNVSNVFFALAADYEAAEAGAEVVS